MKKSGFLAGLSSVVLSVALGGVAIAQQTYEDRFSIMASPELEIRETAPPVATEAPKPLLLPPPAIQVQAQQPQPYQYQPPQPQPQIQNRAVAAPQQGYVWPPVAAETQAIERPARDVMPPPAAAPVVAVETQQIVEPQPATALLPDQQIQTLQPQYLETQETVSYTALRQTVEQETAVPQRYFLRLEDKNHNTGKIFLQGEYDRYVTSIRLPAHMRDVTATVRLSLTNSVELLPENSFLTVSIENDRMAEPRFISNLPLTAHNNPLTVALKIPSAFQAGENRLIFEVRQKHRLLCSFESSFELWTQLDPENSYVEFDLDQGSFQPSLSQLDGMLSSDIMGNATLTILRPTDAQTDASLGWGAHLAQGFALRRKGQNFDIDAMAVPRTDAFRDIALPDMNFPGIDQTALPRTHLVLAGEKSQLRGLVSDRILAQVADAYLGVYPLDASADRFVILVTGRSAAEVREAARAFAEPGYTWPARAYASTSDLSAPIDSRLHRRDYVMPDKTYEIGSAFGFKSRPWYGVSYDAETELYLPEDYFVTDDSVATLNINANYADGLAPEAALAVLVNDVAVGSIRLDREVRTQISNYEINVPLRQFHAGRNVIRFEAYLPPNEQLGCSANLATPAGRFQIFEDTSITFPEFARLGELPDLNLTASTAFPYVQSGQAERVFDVFVPATDNQSVAATYLWLGKMAQAAGHDLPSELTAEFPYLSARNLVVVAPFAQLQAEMFDFAPVSYTEIRDAWLGKELEPTVVVDPDSEAERETQRLLVELRDIRGEQNQTDAQPVQQQSIVVASYQDDRRQWDAYLSEKSADRQELIAVDQANKPWYERSWDRVVNWWNGSSQTAQANTETVRFGSLLYSNESGTPTALVMQQEAPRSPGKTWTVVTSVNPQMLERNIHRLMENGWWHRQQGAAMAWGKSLDLLRVRPADDTYSIWSSEAGLSDMRLLVGNIFSQTIWIWVGIMIAILFLFAFLTYFVVRRVGQNAMRR